MQRIPAFTIYNRIGELGPTIYILYQQPSLHKVSHFTLEDRYQDCFFTRMGAAERQ